MKLFKGAEEYFRGASERGKRYETFQSLIGCCKDEAGCLRPQALRRNFAFVCNYGGWIILLKALTLLI